MKRMSIAERTLQKQIERMSEDLKVAETQIIHRQTEADVIKYQRWKLERELDDLRIAREASSERNSGPAT